MKIGNKLLKIGVFDIETYLELFDFGLYDPDTDSWTEFEISLRKNDLFALCKYLQGQNYDYWVSFNGINFDHQVLNYILDNHQDWFDLKPLEICAKIHHFANQVIENQNYEIKPPYKESDFFVKSIDLFKIRHFDNKQRRTSLKACEAMMNIDVEQMPLEPTCKGLTSQDIESIIDYRRHDVIATYCLLYLTIGDLNKLKEVISTKFGVEVNLEELADYEGKNKLQDRFDLMDQELLLDCINYSDSKIGDELNKMTYCQLAGKTMKDLFNLRKDRSPTKKFTYGDAIPSYVSFKTKPFIEFYESLKDERVSLLDRDKQEYPFSCNGTDYVIARGGIHSCEKNRSIIKSEGMILRDADVGSQYPNAIRKRKLFPSHLGIEWNRVGEQNIKLRLECKRKSEDLSLSEEERRKYKGLSEMFKLALNSGYFGKTLERTNWQYAPEVGYYCTIGNQFEILMLIEMLETQGIRVVNANTDGILCYFNQEKDSLYYEICHEWEKIVGNSDLGKLEYTDFDFIYQESVNSYIAKKSKGGVKKKGRFLTTFDLHKNKSKRIIPLAMEKYFVEKISPIDFITSHNNVFDYLVVKKASREMYYEHLFEDKSEVYKKLIRYYISTDGGIMKKRGKDANGASMDDFCEAPSTEFPWFGTPKTTYLNKYDMFKGNIDKSYYILKTLERIDKIEKTKKAKKYADNFKTQQTSLW